MCLTDHPDNGIVFHRPEGYDPLWYELLRRNFEAGEAGMPCFGARSLTNRTPPVNLEVCR